MTPRMLLGLLALCTMGPACGAAPEPQPARAPTAQRQKDAEKKEEAPLVAPPPAYGHRVVQLPPRDGSPAAARAADAGQAPRRF